MNIVKFSLLFLIATYLGACSGQSPSSVQTNQSAKSGSVTDPCGVITREDVAAVLGQQVGAAQFRESPRPNCHYSVGEGSVSVFAFNDPSAAGAFRAGKTMQDAHTETVADVGDEAYWSPDIKTLNVLKGSVYFTVQYYGVPSGSKETMKALAQKAVVRLP
jgi:hypothetical protein